MLKVQIDGVEVEVPHGATIMDAVNQSMKLIHYAEDDEFYLEVREVRDHERPPMLSIPEYRARHHAMINDQ